MTEIPHDELLIPRCRAADPEALTQLGRVYGYAVHGFLCAILGEGVGKKERFLREAFAEALRLYAPGKSAPSFLTLVTQALMEILRGDPSLAKEIKTPPFMVKDLRLQWMFEAFYQLPWQERAVLLLRLQMDFLVEEMAFIFSEPEAAVKTRLKKAREHFRQQMEERIKGQYRELQSDARKNP